VTAHRHRRRHCCLALLSVLLLAHPSAAPAEKLVAAWSSVSAVNSPLWIMHDAGFFKQEGLDVDLIFVLSSPTVAKATLAGEVAVSGANSQVIVDSGLAGADLIAMGSMSNVVAFYIMAGPEIRSVADLKGKTVLVNFWATWCGPCKAIAPIVEDLAKEYDGKVKVGKVDVDDNQQTAIKYGIRSIPTLLIMKNGKVNDTIVGAVPKAQIVQKLNAAL